MPEYRYELRRSDEVIATGHLSREQPFEVGERITIGSRSGIVRSIEPSLGERELRLVVQLRRDDLRKKPVAGRSTARTRSESRACGSRRWCWCGESQRVRFVAVRFVRVCPVAFAAAAFLRVGVGFVPAGVRRCVFAAVVSAVSLTV